MIINNQNYKEIIITTTDGELIADITDENIIEQNGYRVECVPEDD